MPATVVSSAAWLSLPSPRAQTKRSVTEAVKATLTRLLPSRMVERRRSGSAIIRATLRAPGTSVFTRWATVAFCSDRKAASELEKKAERTRKTRARTMAVSGIWFPPVSGGGRIL